MYVSNYRVIIESFNIDGSPNIGNIEKLYKLPEEKQAKVKQIVQDSHYKIWYIKQELLLLHQSKAENSHTLRWLMKCTAK